MADDSAAIAMLIRELWDSSDVTPVYAAHCLSRTGHAVLLREDDTEGMGLISFSTRPGLYPAVDRCLIEDLVVNAHRRGHGVGHALLAELVRHVELAGCKEISVSTMFSSARTTSFLKHHGLTAEAVLLEKHFSPCVKQTPNSPRPGTGPACLAFRSFPAFSLSRQPLTNRTMLGLRPEMRTAHSMNGVP